MTGISISIGRESSDDELHAVKQALSSDTVEVHVEANLIRLSQGQLPMTIMIWVASGIAPNVMWDLIKYGFKKMIADKRLERRKPTLVLRRKTSSYEAIIADGVYRVQSVDETVTFNTLEELIEYDKARTDRKQAKK